MTIGKRKLEFTFSILVGYFAAALAAAQTTATPEGGTPNFRAIPALDFTADNS
jgi:hypothetical protein